MRTVSGRSRAAGAMVAMAVAAASFLSQGSVTDAAWTDDEYANTAVGVMIAGDCSTTTLFQTESSARQLSGVLGGQDLDSLVSLQGLSVENRLGLITAAPGSAIQIDPVTFTAPLEAGTLGTPLLSATLGFGMSAGAAGAYNQWGRARGSGQSAAAAGAVSDQSGAIDATGTADGSATMPRSASINMAALVPGSTAGMTLDVGAVASTAEADACLLANGWPTPNPVPVISRNYGIAGVDLTADAPAVGAMTTAAGSAFGDAAGGLAAVDDPSGQVTAAINAGITALVQGSLVGLNLRTVTTSITVGGLDLSALTPLLTGTISDGAVTIDAGNSTITADLAALRGGARGLNGLPANTAIGMDEALVNEISQRVAALAADWSADSALALQQAVAAASFTMKSVVVLQADVFPLGKYDVARLEVSYGTALGAFLGGAAPAPTITTEVLNGGVDGLDVLLAPVVGALNGGTGSVVRDALVPAISGAGSLMPAAVAAIDGPTHAVAGELETALDPLAGVLTFTVNVQPDRPGAPVSTASAGNSAPGEFKVSALRIAAAGNAEIYLATAAAGPAVFRPGAG